MMGLFFSWGLFIGARTIMLKNIPPPQPSFLEDATTAWLVNRQRDLLSRINNFFHLANSNTDHACSWDRNMYIIL